ncbi:MAG: NAD(P)/FAD-dependent oxidoreductase [Gammaproteobacteria bacterium]|nr:NAD(P)/FAD-dependent oxidoreductase [Gammaproteobacteria bacterium]MDH3464562.1 NAD(P)/FAD-dependent oxidoreductase [Gammaproteobacteria bacterium]
MKSVRYDAIVVGGGHNGLVCANYLARARQRVLLLEAADQVGGAAATESFAPGFRVSSCAHLVYLFDPSISAELKLADHGLVWSAVDLPSVALSQERAVLSISSDPTLSAGEWMSGEHKRFDALMARMTRFASVLQNLYTRVPPRLRNRRGDIVALVQAAWRIRRLGRDDMRELLRIAGMNIADLLDDELNDDRLKGMLAFDAVLGTRLGPRAPNTVFTWLHRLVSRAPAAHGGIMHPLGGVGALCDALSRSAQAAGVEIRTGARVESIMCDADRVTGVRVADGEEIGARQVISNADPQQTLLSLLGARELDTEFVRRVRDVPMAGTAAKLHLAIDDLPTFVGVDPEQARGRLVIAPNIDYVERASNAIKYGEYAPQPVIEITIPSLHDSTLAPPGKHVLSAIVQYAPYTLRAGWGAHRDEFADCVIAVLAEYAPDLPDKIVERQLLLPVDIEQRYGMTGGHWHHGELGLERFWMWRPTPGAAQYQMPVEGLFLCGAGCHPGGGVMGLAGRNAARAVLATARP